MKAKQMQALLTTSLQLRDIRTCFVLLSTKQRCRLVQSTVLGKEDDRKRVAIPKIHPYAFSQPYAEGSGMQHLKCTAQEH
jgi:hypothetical protein